MQLQDQILTGLSISETAIRKAREVRNPAKWRAILEDWKASGLSKREFCASRGVVYARFLYHHAKSVRPKISVPDSRFVPIKIIGQAERESEALVLQYPSGIKILVPVGSDASTFNMMVSVMRELT